ncbi:hypothetical protein SFRURICE_001824, partial [Spodoptera frugiperda]
MFCPITDVIQVWSAPGGMTRLPCDLAAPVSEVALMFWFKEGDRMPIYTLVKFDSLKLGFEVSKEVALGGSFNDVSCDVTPVGGSAPTGE